MRAARRMARPAGSACAHPALMAAAVSHGETNGKKISHLLALAAFLNYNGGKLCGLPSPVERIATWA